MNILLLCATMMQHLVGGKKILSFTLFLVIKAKIKFLKITLLLLQHHCSRTVWYSYCQNLFPSKFDRSFLPVSTMHLTTATVTQLWSQGSLISYTPAKMI